MFSVNVKAIIKNENKILTSRHSSKEEHAGGKLSFIGGTVEGIDKD